MTKNIILRLQALMHFYNDPDGYGIEAGHDVIYTYLTDKPLPDEIVIIMINLGVVQENVSSFLR